MADAYHITENVIQFNNVNCSGHVKNPKMNSGYQVKRDLYQAINPKHSFF